MAEWTKKKEEMYIQNQFYNSPESSMNNNSHLSINPPISLNPSPKTMDGNIISPIPQSQESEYPSPFDVVTWTKNDINNDDDDDTPNNDEWKDENQNITPFLSPTLPSSNTPPTPLGLELRDLIQKYKNSPPPPPPPPSMESRMEGSSNNKLSSLLQLHHHNNTINNTNMNTSRFQKLTIETSLECSIC